MKDERMKRFLMILDANINRKPQTAWYKNCKSVRKRNAKICQSCPFRSYIETKESSHE